MRQIKHFIDGKWQNGEKHLTTFSPVDLSPFASAPIGSRAEVGESVAAALRAFEHWSALSFAERAARVKTLVDGLRQAYGEANKSTPLKQCIVDEVGKPL